MAKYKPPVKKSSGGPQGHAVIQVKDGEFRIKLVEDLGDDKTETHIHVMKIKDQSEEIRELIVPGEYFAKINSDGDKLYTLRPWTGVFDVKFLEFAHEKDKKPAPKQRIYTAKDGSTKNTTLNCLALLKSREGYVFPYFLRYPFYEEQDEEGKSIAGIQGNMEWQGKITAVGIAMEFYDVTGLWDFGPLPYKDNLLPSIEARLNRANKKFKVLIKKGNIDSIFGSESEPKSEKLPDDEIPF